MSTLPSFVSSTPVETPRLRLRPMTSDDVAAAAAIRVQPEVYAYLSHGALTPAQLEARLRLRMARTNLANDTESEVQLVVEALGEEGDAAVVVGDCGFKVARAWTQNDAPTESLVARIHYAMSPLVAGRGLGTELVGALVTHLFAEPHVHRIQADVFADNVASRTVLERNGFRQEGYFVDDGIIDGKFVDACLYSLLRREW
ncbi:GNAT family N-acetyltransferase [Dermacoccus barathri]|uniref:GNAT family N-acetyltransferase n=1 Tax=Dermacoccus barathri TaxID=322601 RepID=UPI001879D693|nr:GNAT family protein [Dermacoccus barathri]MBE7372260.1 GNAT family N-acetyltransferase [Dermacoccus barathri]